MKKLVTALGLVAAVIAEAAHPLVSVDSFEQAEGSREVTVSYTVSGASAIVTMEVFTNGVTIGDRALSNVRGEVNCRVAPGIGHVLRWKPGKVWGVNRAFTQGEVSVRLTAHPMEDPPDYLVVDLVSGATNYYRSAEALPGGLKSVADPSDRGALDALITDPYRTTKLVMRRIRAAGVEWFVWNDRNANRKSVAFSDDYWIGIYELTQAQRKLVVGDAASHWTGYADSQVRPVDNINGATDERGGVAWPASGHAVPSGCPIDKFRKATGLALDLPTAAQWEYACRCGSESDYPYGEDVRTDPPRYAWLAENSADIRAGTNATWVVGVKEPNAWGLYDMLGNVWEWMLDYGGYASASSGRTEIDYPGLASGGNRQRRGGSFRSESPVAVYSSMNGNYDNKNYHSGCRLVCPVTKWADSPAEVASGVAVVQDPASRLVSVSYRLDAPAVVTIDVFTNGVKIGTGAGLGMFGDVNGLVPAGTGTAYWQPRSTWPGFALDDAVSFKVTQWSEKAPPDYMACDLRPGMKEWRRYYVSAEDVPGGVTNVSYKTDRLLVRRIPAAGVTWRMGTPAVEKDRTAANQRPHKVVLTEDYYIGVYELTQAQYVNLVGENPSGHQGTDDAPLRPAEFFNQKYPINSLRGNREWPENDAVGASSVMGVLRTRSGCLFDLPTEAQWEFACRAGTGSRFYWGCDTTEQAGDYAWFKDNSGNDTHPVGMKLPNGYGLYDMVGNVGEWCLLWLCNNYGLSDWSDADWNDRTAVDPNGGTSSQSAADGKSRCAFRGGYCGSTVSYLASGSRQGQNDGADVIGVRVCCPVR